MKGFLLDTCGISEFSKISPDLGLISWLARVNPTIVFLSAVTIGELQYGISRAPDGQRRRHLERWLRSDVLPDFEERILPFDGEVAERWGRLRAERRKSGTPIPAIDAMIAATALQYNLAVVTRNEADFQGTGIDILNPWSE